MPLVTKTSPAAQMAVGYITVGALVLVWSGVWMTWLFWQSVSSSVSYFLCTGTMLSGLALLVIGLCLGYIGRAAKHAEQPAELASQTVRDHAGNVMTTAPAPAVAPVQAPPAVVQPGAPQVPQPIVTAPANGASRVPVGPQ
jgi:hypothetical protein